MRNLYSIVSFWIFIGAALNLETVSAQNYPTAFTQVLVANGISRPTALAFAPDGRLFVCEQGGNLRVVKNNALLSTPFVQLSVNSSGERGLLGVAVDPDFATNKFVYLYYTTSTAPIRNRISRFTANGDVAQAGSETVILDLDPLSTATIHNGGAMHFGADGKLYIAVGENSNAANAQNLDSYHGKLLRINKDGSVPSGNPFTTGSEQRRRVWAYGLRNPFTFAVDRLSGRIFVNDVGGNTWEEINDATDGGKNFGWPTTEGRFNQTTFPNLTNPLYAYAHGAGDGVGCAITGGTFFNPTATNYPATYKERYFFVDNCNHWINTLTFSGSTATRSSFATSIATNSLNITTGPDGNLYFLSRGGQSLYKVVFTSSTPLTITNHPANASVAVGQPATFNVSVLGTPPITYQWQKNEDNILNATNATYTIPQANLTDAGQYRVIVSNAGGSVTSNPATLAVLSNELPVATITSPAAGTTYVAGTSIGFSGQGTDAEDGTLPAQAHSWEINFHHDNHKHDQPPINGIKSGTFNIPNEGETANNVWYRIILTVTDNNGLKGKDSVDIFPLKSTLSFRTVPPGLQILLDGQPFNTPNSVLSVEGILRNIDAPTLQTVNGTSYQFVEWTHGGNKNQTIATPTNDVTYTANFTEVENTKSFYRAINLNGSSMTLDGNNWEASAGAPNFSYSKGSTFVSTTVPLIPATDANRTGMIRSSIWGRVTITISAVPAGNYEVWVYTWEDNRPATFSLFLEGTNVQPNYNTGPAGTWRKLGPFPVNITDGTIQLNADGFEANLSGIEIWNVGQTPPVNNPPVLSNPIANQGATVGVPFTFTFPATTFTDPDAGDVLRYTATTPSGQTLPAWITFDNVTRTFSGTPGTSNAGPLELRVTATDNAGAQANDTFIITVESPVANQLYRAINLNGPALVIDGNNWEASSGAANLTITNASSASYPNIALIPATDPSRTSMIQSFLWGRMNIAIGSVPSGIYEVWLYTWEDNSPTTYSILLEGDTVLENYKSGTRGTWAKIGPFVKSINDGTINLRLTGFEANLSGIEILRGSGNLSSARSVAANTMDEEGPLLLAYPNPSSEPIKIEFTASSSATSNLSVFDIRGQKISGLFEGYVEKGKTTEAYLDPAGMADGIYILQLVNGKETKRLKLLVRK